MKINFRVFLAITSLALAGLACQALTGGGQSEVPTSVPNTVVPVIPEATVMPEPTSVPEETGGDDILFEDDFSAGRTSWGTGTDTDSAVEYVDEALNFQLFTQNYTVWSSANDKEYENTHIEVTVLNNESNATTAFGIICYQQFITDSHYYFAITPAGEYAIAKAALAQDDVFLTNNDEWGDSDLIAKDAASYRLGVDCGNGKLTLYVDGQEIDSVSDSTYTSGSFALFVWKGDDAAAVDVSFDDFIMTQLP